MVERDQDKGAEAPENKGVGQAGQGPLADDLGLESDLPDEIPEAPADGREAEAGVWLGMEDFAEDNAEAEPETGGGGGNQQS